MPAIAVGAGVLPHKAPESQHSTLCDVLATPELVHTAAAWDHSLVSALRKHNKFITTAAYCASRYAHTQDQTAQGCAWRVVQC